MSEELTAQQQAFVELYSNPDGDCWSNALRSAERAGYSQNGLRGAAHKLMANPEIRIAINEAVTERVAECLYSPDIVKANLERLRRLAEEKADLSTAVRCVELLGKTWALFSEKSAITVDTHEETERLNDVTRAESQRIAEIRLREITHTTAPNTLPPGEGV
jgi:hypothetical protein